MKDIKVEVRFTEGYKKRFTEACLKQLQKRDNGDVKAEKDHQSQQKTA